MPKRFNRRPTLNEPAIFLSLKYVSYLVTFQNMYFQEFDAFFIDIRQTELRWTGLNNVCACAQLWRAKIGLDNNLIENGGYFKIL